jgi:hypothetical protein
MSDVQRIPWNSGRMMLALVRYFDWRVNRVMNEAWIDGGRADLVFVSKAGYATEIEIKISLSDWAADRKKDKFKMPRPHVARFYYAIPDHLLDRVPFWLAEDIGIIVVRDGDGRDYASEYRAAKRMPRAQKLPPSWWDNWRDNAYYRYWHAWEKQRRVPEARAA